MHAGATTSREGEGAPASRVATTAEADAPADALAIGGVALACGGGLGSTGVAGGATLRSCEHATSRVARRGRQRIGRSYQRFSFGLPKCTAYDAPAVCVAADGAMSWASASQLVQNMNKDGGTGYLGQTTWQLPPMDPSCDASFG